MCCKADYLLNKSIKIDSAESNMTLQKDRESIPNIYLFDVVVTVHYHYQDSVEKDRRIRELSASHDNEMHKMDTELCSARLQLDSVRAE